MDAIQAREAGGPDVLQLVDIPEPSPGPGQVAVRVTVAGVNFIDTYRRGGVYPMPFPHTVGSEGAGTVAAVGAGVSDVAVGDRVAWCEGPGSYAELVLVAAEKLAPIPDEVSDDLAAALMLQGITAHYLATSTYAVTPGDHALVHAAAGGVGLLLTQLITARGGRVIGTVSTAEKEALAREAGADVVRYDLLDDITAELPALVRAATDGLGVHVAYDGVGKATFDASLASLRRRGTLVLFGGASGQVPPFELQRLNAGGSLFVTRPKIDDYTATREEFLARSEELFALVAGGELDVRIGARFALADAEQAHRALEGRATTGKVILEV